MVNPKIFKAYDIRGTYPDEINEDAAYRVGRSFVRFLGAKKIAVGRDVRKSSPSLFEKIIEGVIDEGSDVIDIGICNTPMLNFTIVFGGLDGGIMVSASHNPPEYNAFKVMKKKAVPLHENSGIKEIEKIANSDFENRLTKGNIIKKDILPDYLSHISVFTKDIKNLKVVCDYGNGVGAISAKPIFDKLPIEVIHLFPIPDGRFPNHLANPQELDNLKTLQGKVISENADLGIFFDGDADRSTLVDENGKIILPDLEIAVLAEEELKKYPGEKVCYDLRFSKVVGEVIKKLDGYTKMMRVGSPFYKEELIENGGILAGELSGHIFFKDNYYLDDGLFAAVKIMSILSKTGKKISELVKPLRKYYQTEEINLEVDNADKVLAKIRETYKDGESIELDGVYIKYPNWWFSLRKSNTEPIVRLRIEADTKNILEEKRKELLGLIEK